MDKLKTPQGEVLGKEVEFAIVTEPWGIYRIKGSELDGHEVRARLVLTRLWLICDEEGNVKFLEDGSPQIHVSMQHTLIAK